MPRHSIKYAGILLFHRDASTVRVLLVRRVRDGFWSIPGGHVECGETPEEGARREFWEETKIVPPDPDQLTVLGDNRRFRVFLAEAAHPLVPSLCSEHDESMWAPLSNLPEPLYPGFSKLLRDV